MIEMTLELANAIAQDTANRNMKAHGRSAWNEDDLNLAVQIVDKLWWHREIKIYDLDKLDLQSNKCQECSSPAITEEYFCSNACYAIFNGETYNAEEEIW